MVLLHPIGLQNRKIYYTDVEILILHLLAESEKDNKAAFITASVQEDLVKCFCQVTLCNNPHILVRIQHFYPL